MNVNSDPPESRLRILIVDDEPFVSELLGEMLKLLGYRPAKCLSPVAALDLVGQQDFDVILTDFHMPQMNGDEFYLQTITQRPELAARFIFLTGDSMNEQMLAFLDRHGTRHLSKPFDLASVERVISEVAAGADAVHA